MKNWIAAGIATICLVGCFEKEPSLDSDKAKASYAIGQQIGGSLQSQGMDVDVDVINMSIRDALAKKEPRISETAMREAMGNLQKAMVGKRKEEAETNLKTGTEFLENNKKAKGIKTTKSGLQYQVLKEGKGNSPSADATVKVHYRGTLINGTEFDSSYKRDQPAEFPVSGVIPGWTEALQLMKPGGKWKLYIPPGLAYGDMGRPSIPPNSVLIFEVELLEVKAKG